MMVLDKFELNITCRGTLEFTLMFYTLGEHLLFFFFVFHYHGFKLHNTNIFTYTNEYIT